MIPGHRGHFWVILYAIILSSEEQQVKMERELSEKK